MWRGSDGQSNQVAGTLRVPSAQCNAAQLLVAATTLVNMTRAAPARGACLLQIEAVQIHHLAPRRGKVTHKCPLRVVAGIEFGEGPELGVRTKDQVDRGSGPPGRARLAIATLIDVLVPG